MDKVLFLSDVDFNSPGGAQESMNIIMKGLSEHYEFYIITPNGQRSAKNQIIIENFTDFKLRGKRIHSIVYLIFSIAKKIKEINPNIIHVQMPSTMIIVTLLKQMGLLPREALIVYTDRGVYGKYRRITTSAIDKIIKYSDRVVVTTNNNLGNYKENYKYFERYKGKFTVIYNTAGHHYENYDVNQRLQVRSSLDISEEIVVGLCGRYNAQKDWPLSQRIIKSIYESLDRFEVPKKIKILVVIGTDGSEINYEEAKGFIATLKKDVGENNLISFLNVDSIEMANLFYAIDVFLMTSKSESFGRTAVEAMSRQCAVIGTDVDGLSEVIGNKKYTFKYFEEGSSKVLKLITNEETLKRSKNYFYKRYYEMFSCHSNVQQYKNLYDEILKAK